MTPKRVLWALVLIATVAALIIVAVKKGSREVVEERPPSVGGFKLSSTAFEYGGTIPAVCTCDGADISPPLVWENVPEGTVTFALIMEDPDARISTFTHWLICEIPGRTRALPPKVPNKAEVASPVSAVQGNNGFRKLGYGGPCPPAGKPHRYYFRLYALDAKLDMIGGFNRRQLLAAMKDHILAEAELMGRYARTE
ncbi:MAG: YbhB/YbcL family Raf kinase inhibitor-like protein [Candidatus Brocadiae bacterium]|nr:YbhB/YbcL family Raf kinase inhibitor-like protein [Candidatus Brocadiia bacterium]